MKSTLIALGLAATFLAPAAYSSPLTATQHAQASSAQKASVHKTKATKHAKAKRHHRAAKKA